MPVNFDADAMGPKYYICDRKALSEEWLIPLTKKGYKVTSIEVKEEKDFGEAKNGFYDGSVAWIVSDGARTVGVACYETPAGAEAMIHFSSLFIWFGGNFKLAGEVESSLLDSGAMSK